MSPPNSSPCTLSGRTEICAIPIPIYIVVKVMPNPFFGNAADPDINEQGPASISGLTPKIPGVLTVISPKEHIYKRKDNGTSSKIEVITTDFAGGNDSENLLATTATYYIGFRIIYHTSFSDVGYTKGEISFLPTPIRDA